MSEDLENKILKCKEELSAWYKDALLFYENNPNEARAYCTGYTRGLYESGKITEEYGIFVLEWLNSI